MIGSSPTETFAAQRRVRSKRRSKGERKGVLSDIVCGLSIHLVGADVDKQFEGAARSGSLEEDVRPENVCPCKLDTVAKRVVWEAGTQQRPGLLSALHPRTNTPRERDQKRSRDQRRWWQQTDVGLGCKVHDRVDLL